MAFSHPQLTPLWVRVMILGQPLILVPYEHDDVAPAMEVRVPCVIPYHTRPRWTEELFHYKWVLPHPKMGAATPNKIVLSIFTLIYPFSCNLD